MQTLLVIVEDNQCLKDNNSKNAKQSLIVTICGYTGTGRLYLATVLDLEPGHQKV